MSTEYKSADDAAGAPVMVKMGSWDVKLTPDPTVPTDRFVVIQTPVGNIKLTADPTLRPGEFAVTRKTKYGVIATPVDALLMKCSAEFVIAQQNRRIEYLAMPVGERRASLVPVLHDGLTAEQCLERFQQGQRERPRSAGRMTTAQIAAARDLWSSQLRARIAASRESDKARQVSVCVEMEVD